MDDGAGIEVIRRLSGVFGPGLSDRARLLDAGTDGMSLMFKARGASWLVVVDACKSGSEPGAIFEVPGRALEGKPPASYTLHDFRWQHALYAGRRIFKSDFPARVSVFLIECQSLDYGVGLTPPIQRAVDTVVSTLADRIRAQPLPS